MTRLSFIVLDTGHTHSVASQVSWLDSTLAARTGVPHLFAAYHVPAFPSHRSFNGGQSPKIREHWLPLFEEHGLDVGYEHHEHTYKRTHPIRNGQVSPDGVLYLGDGAMGANTRSVHPADQTWYLARSRQIHHFILTTIQGDTRTHEAVDRDGNVFDRAGN